MMEMCLTSGIFRGRLRYLNLQEIEMTKVTITEQEARKEIAMDNMMTCTPGSKLYESFKSDAVTATRTIREALEESK